jgi:transposase
MQGFRSAADWRRSGNPGQAYPSRQTVRDPGSTSYDAILANAIAFHDEQPPLPVKRQGSTPRRTGHNLALRLATFKHDVLRFLTDPTVPFSNNIAEHDARMAKLRQKISGGFRSLGGATDFAVLRSLISTARKQGWNILAALTADPSTLESRLKLA